MLMSFFALNAAMFTSGVQFQLEHSKDSFGTRSHGIFEVLASGRRKFYPLPQSTAREYARLRPEDLRMNPFKPEEYERQEVIGPSQVENGKIWFGKEFYDDEGISGVGAFGYFDTSSRVYTLFSPPEMARYEVSAILARPDSVFVALDSFGEDMSKAPGGLIRWDRTTQKVQRYPLEFGVSRISIDGETIRLKASNGYALLRNGKIQRFLDNGKAISKFPQPRTLY